MLWWAPMVTNPLFFRDLAYVFGAAVVGGAAARALRQPLILGYVAGGILISPLTPGPSVSDLHTFDLFAEIGVILLMFSIGIEFSLRDLLRVKWEAILGGPLGILLSVALGVGVGQVIGWTVIEGAVMGMVISVASTMVLARLLIDRGELHTRHGRIMIGITLVEDLAVVVLIILIPRLGALEPGRLLSIGGGIGLALAILAPFLYLAKRVVPPLLGRVARTRNQELFLLVALALGLGTAAITQAVGLSLALGAFLAGLLVTESEYAHEVLSRLLPLRDAFVALFFVTVGAIINPASLLVDLPRLGAIVGLVVAGKLVIWTIVVCLFRHPPRTACLVAVGLTQIGEFSFILIRVARDAGHVQDGLYQATLAASLLTILVNAALVRWAPAWLGADRPHGRAGLELAEEPARAEAHTVLCGFGRVGSAVAEALETFGVPYVAVDLDPEVVRDLRRRGVPCVYGDAAQRGILEAAGAGHADLLIVALPDVEHVVRAVREARGLNLGAPILARCHDPGAVDRLAGAGATEIIQPEFEAAATLVRHALRRLDQPRERVLAYLERLRGAVDAMAETGEAAGAALPEVREVTVAGGELADQPLWQARLRERFGVTVVAVTRADGEQVPYPMPDTVLRPGDRLKVFGLPPQIAELQAALRATG